MTSQEILIMFQINLGGTNRERIHSSWQDDPALMNHNLSITENSEQEQMNFNLGNNQNGIINDQDNHHNLIEKDIEFIKKHAPNVDVAFIRSLLDSQKSNPKKMEIIMGEILNIPNAGNLIKEVQTESMKIGEKRPISNSTLESVKGKKKKSQETQDYLNQIRDMFPDADGLFLISECQQLESWEDCSRFINTVMISGLYPRKEAFEHTSNNEVTKEVEIINYNQYRTVNDLGSEEEISSSGLTEVSRRKKQVKKKYALSASDQPSTSGISNPLLNVTLVDLTSDGGEPYVPPNAEILNKTYNDSNNKMEVDESSSDKAIALETTLADDIDNLLKSKFGPRPTSEGDNLFEEPQEAGPSAGSKVNDNNNLYSDLPSSRRKSLNRDERFVTLESLAEIIEDSKLDVGDYDRPSASTSHNNFNTVKALNESETNLFNESIVFSDEVSSTTTMQPAKTDTEFLDVLILEESEDRSKLNEEWLTEQTSNLIRIFPNTDPSYLREEVAKMEGSMEKMNEFVVSKLERNNMPTRAEYEKKLEMEELLNRYTKNFSIEDFLKAVPDPWQYFTQGNRNCEKYKYHSLCYLKMAFRRHYVRDIISSFCKNKSNLYLTYLELKNSKQKQRGNRRSDFECNANRPTTIDIQFLQEVAFIENEEKIKDYIEGEQIARQIKLDEARRSGTLLECQCCFDSEVMVEDVVYCPKDHLFCKECVTKCVEVEMGKGNCRFKCLTNCEEIFSIACLQNVLKPELFSKVIQANQIEEIRAAEIEDLVQCPFCNYATIMPPEEKVLICLNPECMKESCRLCKELNHIPLRCDEVEKSEEVKLRTYIENKMTEALVRTCYKCGKKFVKEDGCNKMTCTCGAKMCYICRKPVSDYSHFNGQGGTEYHKCPLYSTNDELHVDLVKRIGEEAKAEIMQANPQTKLLHDPTINMPEKTHDRPMPGMYNGPGLIPMPGGNLVVNVLERAALFARGNIDAALDGGLNPYRRYRRYRAQSQTESEDEADNHNYNNNNYSHHHHHHHHHHHRNHHRRHYY